VKTIAIAVGSLIVATSFGTFAQRYDDRDYRSYRTADSPRECWNPHAGHFEAVRPGERQDDLDFGRCHYIGESERDMKRWHSGHQECWNPRAQHFEGVRRGEQQDDLDFSRCRNVRDD
jgi:hypothetical protein